MTTLIFNEEPVDPVEFLVRRKFPGVSREFPAPVGPNVSLSLAARNYRKGVILQQQANEYRQALRAMPSAELNAFFELELERARREAAEKAEAEERKRFFNAAQAAADVMHWSKASIWTLEEAVALSFGKDPKYVS